MKPKQILVTKSDTAVIQCPKCEVRKSIPVGQYRGNKHAMKVKCGCSHVFEIALNFRRNFRKNLSLDAIYYSSEHAGNNLAKKTPPTFSTTNCIVKDLSIGGINFEVKGHHMIEAGSKLMITFNLDNAKKTPVHSKITVKSVNGKSIGAEFVGSTVSTTELGFYLMP